MYGAGLGSLWRLNDSGVFRPMVVRVLTDIPSLQSYAQGCWSVLLPRPPRRNLLGEVLLFLGEVLLFLGEVSLLTTLRGKVPTVCA